MRTVAIPITDKVFYVLKKMLRIYNSHGLEVIGTQCELALKYLCSRKEYTNVKASFVESILELARTKA